MDLKILMILLIYWGFFITMAFFSVGTMMEGDIEVNATLNSSAMGAGELDTGGLFGTGVSLGRFAGMAIYGVQFLGDAPSWFTTPFAVWQSIFLIFTIGFVISSIWNG